MHQRKGRQNSDVAKIETYNSIRDELQSQNVELMKERFNILQRMQQAPMNQGHGNTVYEQNRHYSESTPYQGVSPSKTNPQKSVVDNLKYKIEQIINICQNYEESSKQYGKLSDVVEAERSILTYLNQVTNQLVGSAKNISSSRQKNSKKKKARVNKTETSEGHQMEPFRQNIGDEAMEMIQQIQRKALLQIQSLRCDKINLMKRLNEEIKAHNEQKKLRAAFQNQVRNAQSQMRIGATSRQQDNNYMEVVEEQNESNYDQTPPMINTVPQTQSRRQPAQGQQEQQPYRQQQQLRQQQQQAQQSYLQTQQQSYQQPAQRPQSQQQQQYVQHIQSIDQTQQIPQQNQYAETQNIQRVPNQPKNYSKFHPSAENGRVGSSQSVLSPKQAQQVQRPGSERQILLEMERLRNQNQQLKQSISVNPNKQVQVKSQLKSQLSQLSSKIQQYEHLLMNSSRHANNLDMREYQSLLAEANAITEQGNRLLRTRKNPEYRTTVGSFGFEQENNYPPRPRTMVGQREEGKPGRATFDYSRPPLQTFSPMDKSYHSQNYKSGFSPSQYENIIEQMKNATKQ